MKIKFIYTFILSLIVLMNIPLSAHCDGIDGPVVKSAIESLESGNINHILIWIPEDNTSEIEEAFNKTLSVRKLNPEAKELADKFFFETVVRIHRLGEGASYDGLKPAGRDLGPAIKSGDSILTGGSHEDLIKLLNEAVEHGVSSSLHELLEKKNFKPDDVEAGREFVAAYVKFIHQVENIYNSANAHSDHSNKKSEAHKH